ncbi:DUF5954 family protein [Micromonospora aurantiaca (nom. illeg.)]|uniref:DUF5954 family protein n=1 Tax=Micromonospora aurantiaca (nom. illeg.) TaxID=47850 RepID=UPI00379E2FEC
MSDEHGQSGPVVVRVARPEHPVEAVAEDDAARRAAAYPSVRMGGPLFGHAEDLGDGLWCVRALWDDTPQAARDTLAHRFRERLAETTDPALAQDLVAVGRVLDWEKVDEVNVAGRRWRVVRADTFTRFGPDGPESPRPSDPDSGAAGSAGLYSDREGVVVDPGAPVGPVQAMVTVDLLSAHYPAAGVPADVHADSRLALRIHPRGVVLPAGYAVAECVEGRWRPASRHLASPQQAREAIAFKFRYMVPRVGQPTDAEIAAYAQAADEVEATRANEVKVLDHRFRVTRIETLLRFDRDGPEPPRPSDHDPEPPPEAHFAQLREQGLLPEPE